MLLGPSSYLGHKFTKPFVVDTIYLGIPLSLLIFSSSCRGNGTALSIKPHLPGAAMMKLSAMTCYSTVAGALRSPK